MNFTRKTGCLSILGLSFLLMLSACASKIPEEDWVSSEELSSSKTSYIENFPVYTYPGKKEVLVEERQFSLFDIPENPAEALVADHYLYLITGDFDQLEQLYGENEALTISLENEQQNFQEGIYIQKYLIQEISTLSQEEFQSLFSDSLQAEIDQWKLSEMVMVKAVIDLTWSEKGLAQIPQIGDGQYDRFFLCGKHAENSNDWKIFEIYSGEML